MTPVPAQSGPPARLPLDKTALFLDFDGTLVEIAERPEDVAVPSDLPDLLGRLDRGMRGAVAIVSGRTIAALDIMLPNVRLTTVGTHGTELRAPAGSEIRHLGPPLPEGLRTALEALAKTWKSRYPGVRLEDKGTALSVHYRQAPEAGPAILKALQGLSLDKEWQILTGHKIYEVKSASLNKGSAIRDLMQTPDFIGRRPICLGDDRTDLDGIAAVTALGGAGIAVGGLVAPLAEWILPDPTAVRAWLRGLLA